MNTTAVTAESASHQAVHFHHGAVLVSRDHGEVINGEACRFVGRKCFGVSRHAIVDWVDRNFGLKTDDVFQRLSGAFEHLEVVSLGVHLEEKSSGDGDQDHRAW